MTALTVILMNAIDNGRGMQIIQQYWKAGGWLMIPLGMICFLILYRYLFLRHRLREALSTPDSCLLELEERLHNGCGETVLQRRLERFPGAKARIARYLLACNGRGLPLMDVFKQ